jgi:Ca2+-binding EF-hand superfamily protein
MMSARMAEMMKRMPVLRALDKNQDGTISSAEIDQAPVLLRRADRNRDGKISREEMRPRGR